MADVRSEEEGVRERRYEDMEEGFGPIGKGNEQGLCLVLEASAKFVSPAKSCGSPANLSVTESSGLSSEHGSPANFSANSSGDSSEHASPATPDYSSLYTEHGSPNSFLGPALVDWTDPKYIAMSRLAIQSYNSKNNKNYKFVTNLSASLWYFPQYNVVFQAKDDASLETFVARVCLGTDGDGPKSVDFCHLRPSDLLDRRVYDSDDDDDFIIKYADGEKIPRKIQLEYSRQVNESNCFDITFDLDYNITKPVVAPVFPVKRGTETGPEYVELSNLAIQELNAKDKSKSYQFREVVSVNHAVASGYKYYITFEAEDVSATPPALEAFQAVVWVPVGRQKQVKLCRPRPKKLLSDKGAQRPPDSNVDVEAAH